MILDAGSSLNIISLNVLDDIGIPHENTKKQSFQVSSFSGDRTYTIYSLYLNLMMGPIRAAHRFHVIDSQTSYHHLLGRPRIHQHKAISSTCHQCLKVIWKEKKVHINATRLPFQRNESHSSKAQYFQKLVEEREVTIAQPREIPLSAWEDLEDTRWTATILPKHPRPFKK